MASAASIGGFIAADRANQTRLLPDSAQGLVPPGTRAIDVTLELDREAGVRNNGYADSISLVLPEASNGALVAAALAGLAAVRGRRPCSGSLAPP